MKKNRYAQDKGLTVRMGTTMFFIGLLYVVIIGTLVILGLGWFLALAISGVALWAQWFFSDKAALYGMKAQEVTPEQAPELHAIVDRLCAMADMPKPKIAISHTNMANAFATGRTPSKSVVCVTTGLLSTLNLEEVEAVLSHELSHIAHRDVTVITIASFAGVVAGIMTRAALWGGMSRSRDSNTVLLAFAVLVVSVVVYGVSFLLTRTLSRYRELSADRSAALLTGKPSDLASALVKITNSTQAIPVKDLRTAENFNAFFFAPALLKGKSLSSLFSTHPPLGARLENLNKVAQQLGDPHT